MAISKFRPCIDLHHGKVKQIVGGTLADQGENPRENFVSEHGAGYYAARFREDEMSGGHVIQLGPGNEAAAKEALQTWKGGLQLGGGVNPSNAEAWLQEGASHVIVTSWLFDQEGHFLPERLAQLSRIVGKERLVIDLSCRREEEGWVVAMNRWQKKTSLWLTHQTLTDLSEYCDEFLVHAADVEGLCAGMDPSLVSYLGAWKGRPITYAGGISSLAEISELQTASEGHVDYTVGSALDLFGGTRLSYQQLVLRNRGC